MRFVSAPDEKRRDQWRHAPLSLPCPAKPEDGQTGETAVSPIGENAREALIERLRKLSLKDAQMMHELLGELIAEMRAAQVEVVSA